MRNGATLLELKLVQIRLEAEGVASYEFVSATMNELPPFAAGAHIDLQIAEKLTRSYSIVNSPMERSRYVVAVQRESTGRGGSAWMHSTPRVGDVIRSSAPIESFRLVEDAEFSLFVAGGIGITPLMAMVRRLRELGRPWRLYYAARSRRRAAFVNELEELAEQAGHVQLRFSGEGEPRLDLQEVVGNAPPTAHLYCCGPTRMIDAFRLACSQRSVEYLHTEQFGASGETKTGDAFDVVLAKSGETYRIDASKSILDTLLDCGFDVPYTCMAGVCGACRTAVVSGDCEHRDDFLTAQEKHDGRSIMLCVSRAATPTLVLDL